MECTFPPCHSGSFSAIARTMPSSTASLVCTEFAINPGRITARQTIIRFLIMSLLTEVRAQRRAGALLSEQLLDEGAGNVGQAEVPALEAVRQLCVLQPHEVQDSRMQVVDVNLVFNHVVP